jgi:hypothetical protein
MNQNLQTPDTTTAPGLLLGRRFASLLEEIRIRRIHQSGLARQIASYPAMRGVGTVVLPS